MGGTANFLQYLMRPRILAVVGVVNALLAVLIAYSGWQLVQARQVSQLEDFGDAPAFTLTDQTGRPFSSDKLRGKVAVANFIYTSCTDTCPLLSVRMQALQDRLRQEGLLGTRAQLLSFTVDPAHDTPEVLRAYAERHRADPRAWRFLTGPREQVVPVIVDGFFQGVVPIPATPADRQQHVDDDHAHDAPSLVMHSNRFVLIDREGRMRGFYDGLDLDLDQVVSDIRQLLR